MTLLQALRLKTIPRAGWLRVGIRQPESVADHSWGVAFLAVSLCPPDLDRVRVLELAILHDLPEVIVGDITPHDGISRAEKARREAEAADVLFADQPSLHSVWREYVENTTPEARFVHALDKLEMALQAEVYGENADTREFIESARRALEGSPLASRLPGGPDHLPTAEQVDVQVED